MKYFMTKEGYIVDENNQHIPQIEGTLLYEQYHQYLIDDGAVENTNYEVLIEMDNLQKITLEQRLMELQNEINQIKKIL